MTNLHGIAGALHVTIIGCIGVGRSSVVRKSLLLTTSIYQLVTSQCMLPRLAHSMTKQAWLLYAWKKSTESSYKCLICFKPIYQCIGKNSNCGLSSKRTAVLRPTHTISCRAHGPGPFTRVVVERAVQAHRVKGPSNEWFRTYNNYYSRVSGLRDVLFSKTNLTYPYHRLHEPTSVAYVMFASKYVKQLARSYPKNK